MITKALVSAVIGLGAAVGAAPAAADPNTFGDLSCSCHQAAPNGTPGVLRPFNANDQLNDGIQAAETQPLPGIPAPH